jgi:hypothetical protein
MFAICNGRPFVSPSLTGDLKRRVQAVETWLQQHHGFGIVNANDVAGWTPEQFRELDRRLEWEYQQAQLGKQIDAIPAAVALMEAP